MDATVVPVPANATGRGGTLNERLGRLHRQMLDTVPAVDRIACALYEPKDDLLKTFISSTRAGEPISAYEYRLSDSPTLSALARQNQVRVLDDLSGVIRPDSEHSRWLLRQGYRSSFTVPMLDGDQFLGFIFFDSSAAGAFTPRVQRDLALFCSLINMTVIRELTTLRSVVASAHIARDFANLRDFETGQHLERMARYSRIIGRALAVKHGLSDEFVEHLYLYAPLHDIGKIGIPDRILLKPGALDPAERDAMRTHVDKGVEIIRKILADLGLEAVAEARIVLNLIGGHHEFLDGSGYPRGLVGDAIPIEARIVTVADIFDALTSKRPYKGAWTITEACAELDRMVQAGKLDPDCVAAIERHSHEIADVAERYREAME